MAISLKSTSFLQLKKHEINFQAVFPSKKPIIPVRRYTPMAALRTTKTVGLTETFSRLRKEGKVAFIPYITAGDPNLSTTAEALKVLDSCGSDIIELGVPYSDPLADGPVIQAAASRSLARGTNVDSIISMLKEAKCYRLKFWDEEAEAGSEGVSAMCYHSEESNGFSVKMRTSGSENTSTQNTMEMMQKGLEMLFVLTFLIHFIKSSLRSLKKRPLILHQILRLR